MSAVVLTRNEPTTEEAIKSLYVQTLKPCDVIVVRDVVPFHHALNLGAAKVKSRFFVQVDSDMILDANCLARLRRGIRPGVGIVVGHLRDALIGRAVGIKLFRTACFRNSRFRDSISPDTDFVGEIAAQGWRTRYVGRRRRSGADQWRTFGEHQPDYTAVYTYRKYLLEGQRYFYRKDIGGIRWHFSRLETSRHPAALVAQIALARGIFARSLEDKLGLELSDDEMARFTRLERFLEPADAVIRTNCDLKALLSDKTDPEVFASCFQTGGVLFESDDAASLVAFFELLNDTRHNDARWIAKIALCKGLFEQSRDADGIRADWELLSEFLQTKRATHGSLIELSRQCYDKFIGLGLRRSSRSVRSRGR